MFSLLIDRTVTMENSDIQGCLTIVDEINTGIKSKEQIIDLYGKWEKYEEVKLRLENL